MTTTWDELADAFPEASAALTDLLDAAWASTDGALLELARVRIATLLGDVVEADADAAAALAAWPTSPAFTARERACLALTEQFVLDANGVTDADVAAVTEHLGGDGCYAFVEAVSVLETFQRARLTVGLRARGRPGSRCPTSRSTSGACPTCRAWRRRSPPPAPGCGRWRPA